MDWQLISSNVVALAAIIAPLIMESKRQKEGQRLEAVEKRKQDISNKDELVISYISSLNSFYEVLEGESEESKIKLKNQAAVVKNRILFEFKLHKLWRTEDIKKVQREESFNIIFNNLKNKIKENDFENSLINVIDITQNILQAHCDSEDYSADCRKELKTLLEIIPIIHSGYKFKSLNKDENFAEDKAKESIYLYIEKYLEDVQTYDGVDDIFKIKETDPSVAEYYKRIFGIYLKDNKNFQVNFEKELGNGNQYGKIHKSLNDSHNSSSYLKIEIGTEIYYINKNCNRSTAEKFIIEKILPLT